MTDKIIIDGIDVSGCENFTTMEDCDGIHELCEQLDDYCSIKKNCCYKQLKRLEAENARLTNLLGEYSLKADAYKNAEDITQQSNYDLSMENFKLKQALTEIKEIAEKSCASISASQCDAFYSCSECGRYGDADSIRQILQKISEVEDE